MTTGASYTDVNAVLPAKTVLAVIAIICALLFFAGAIRRSALLPAVGFGLLVLSAILIGGVYPAIIQQFVVKPNELAKESKYIAREIRSTRLAYGGQRRAGDHRTRARPAVPASRLAGQVVGLDGLRLMDPAVVSATFQQLQQVKGFYQFPGQLSVDRYVLPGGGQLPQDLVVAVRGMGGPPQGQGNWINTHLVYTHGFGFVAAKANAVADGGTPAFVESDIPPHGQLGLYQPRVYFGEQENTYAIVGGPPGRPGQELDYPVENASGQKNYTYNGSGGVPVGSPLNRFLYAIKFRELNILLSGAINSYSKILYDRQPLARVAKVAPFLTLDGNPYPVVANGQHPVGGGRLHHHRPVPVFRTDQHAAGHLHQPDPERGGRRAADRRDQLHPQLGQGGGERLHRGRHPLPVGARRPDAANLDERVPRRHQAEPRHPGLPAAAPALPAGPVRGPAADPGQVPRPEPAVLLRRAELLDRAERPDRPDRQQRA